MGDRTLQAIAGVAMQPDLDRFVALQTQLFLLTAVYDNLVERYEEIFGPP